MKFPSIQSLPIGPLGCLGLEPLHSRLVQPILPQHSQPPERSALAQSRRQRFRARCEAISRQVDRCQGRVEPNGLCQLLGGLIANCHVRDAGQRWRV